MEVIKTLPDARNAIFAITRSGSSDILAFYWLNDEFDIRWIMKTPTNSWTTEPISLVHKVAMDLSLEQEDTRVVIKFPLSLGPNRKLFFVRTPNESREYSIVFHSEEASHGLSKLNEVYLDLTASDPTKCYCRCESLDDRTEFIECVPIDLGSLRSFL
jgi:hypothetical protein